MENYKAVLAKTDRKWAAHPMVFCLPFLMFYIGFICYNSPINLVYDEYRYWGYAQHLLIGQYALPSDTFLWNGPGLPLTLVPFAALDTPLLFPRLLNAFYLYVGLIFFYQTAIRYCQRKTAMIATVALGCYYPLINGYLHLFYTEVLCFFLVSALGYCYSRAIQNNSFGLGQIIWTAIVLAYLILTKVFFAYVVLFLAVIAIIGYAWYRTMQWQKSAIIAGLSLLFCTPYLVYTYGQTQRLFYWANSGGETLYWMSSTVKKELGDWHPLPGDYNAFPEGSKYRFPKKIRSTYKDNHQKTADTILQMTPVERDDYLKNMAFKNIKAHPEKYFKNWGYNLSRLFFDAPYSKYKRAFKWTYLFPNLPFLMALLGLTAYRRKQLSQLDFALWGVLVFALLYLGGTSLLAAYGRFFYIIIPLLMLWLIGLWQQASK